MCVCLALLYEKNDICRHARHKVIYLINHRINTIDRVLTSTARNWNGRVRDAGGKDHSPCQSVYDELVNTFF